MMRLNMLCLRSLVLNEAERVRCLNETTMQAEDYDETDIQRLLMWALGLPRPPVSDIDRFVAETLEDEGFSFGDFREYGYLCDVIRSYMRLFGEAEDA